MDAGYWSSGGGRFGRAESVIKDDNAAGAWNVSEEQSFDLRVVILHNGWIVGRSERATGRRNIGKGLEAMSCE